MNTSRLYLRESGEFEDFNIGFFAHVNYVKGTWTMDGDTIKLTFKPGAEHRILTGKLIIKDEMIFKVEADTLLPTRYYLGQCRGLN